MLLVMLYALIATLVVVFPLLISEYLWRKKVIKSESARKIVHIFGGCVVASLPFWLSYNWIIFLSSGVIVLSVLNYQHRLFKAGLSISRRSYGDFCFGVGVLAVALLKPAPWIFAIAILHVALADGFAAVIGMRFAKKSYMVFGHKKSVIGTLTFAGLSFICVLVGLSFRHDATYLVLPALLTVPIVTAGVENISGYGTDNFTLPLTVLLLLSIFRV